MNQAVGNGQSAIKQINQLRSEMASAFVQRNEIIDALCDGLIAGHHVVLLGPPGTGKSALARALAKALQGKHFQLLMTRYTKPEEVLGPVSIKKIAEEDKVEVQTKGFLPDADTAFLDECFKANSAILNALLTILNEREYSANPAEGPQPIPLKMCVGASNELPEDENSALWDRFMLRFWIDRIADRSALQAILTGSGKGNPEQQINATINQQDLQAAQAEARQVGLPANVQDMLIDIILSLRNRGLQPSERAMVQAAQIVKARAYRRGKVQATPADLDILCCMFWNKPAEVPIVREVVMQIAFPLQSDLQRIEDIAINAYKQAIEPKVPQPGEAIDSKRKLEITQAVIQVTEQIQSQLDEVARIKTQNPDHADMIAEVGERLQELQNKCDHLQRGIMRMKTRA